MEGDSFVGRASIGWAWGTVREGAGAGAPGPDGVGVRVPDVPGEQGRDEPGSTVPEEHELQEAPPIRLGPSIYIAEPLYWP